MELLLGRFGSFDTKALTALMSFDVCEKRRKKIENYE
jgi:hypothetical protein